MRSHHSGVRGRPITPSPLSTLGSAAHRLGTPINEELVTEQGRHCVCRHSTHHGVFSEPGEFWKPTTGLNHRPNQLLWIPQLWPLCQEPNRFGAKLAMRGAKSRPKSEAKPSVHGATECYPRYHRQVQREPSQILRSGSHGQRITARDQARKLPLPQAKAHQSQTVKSAEAQDADQISISSGSRIAKMPRPKISPWMFHHQAAPTRKSCDSQKSCQR